MHRPPAPATNSCPCRLARIAPAPSLLPPQPLLLKDLRIQCRARGLNPGGSREALLERVRDHMLETGNL